MALHRLASTRTADYSPLGSAGQRSFELVRREAAGLGPAHEALFAEPSPSPKGDEVDWYANVPGPIRPLSSASPQEQEAGKARLQELVGAILAAAERLSGSTDQAQRRLGEALRNAVEVPDPGCVYLVGDQPVIVAWAHRRNTNAPARGVLAALAPHARPAAATAPVTSIAAAPSTPEQKSPAAATVLASAPVASSDGSWGWLWWLLWLVVGALALVILWTLLTACGTRWLLPLDYCPRAEAVTAATEADRRDALEAELYRLQRELSHSEQTCRPQPPEPQPNEFDSRVQNEGGQTNAALRITLIWDTYSDLDLHLYCSGGHLFYRNRSDCGGQLDVDKNAGRDISPKPVENIYFTAPPPPGTYKVVVHNYSQKGRNPNNFQLQILKDGQSTVKRGTISQPKDSLTFSFTIP